MFKVENNKMTDPRGIEVSPAVKPPTVYGNRLTGCASVRVQKAGITRG